MNEPIKSLEFEQYLLLHFIILSTSCAISYKTAALYCDDPVTANAIDNNVQLKFI
jgi:hypothetical protein